MLPTVPARVLVAETDLVLAEAIAGSLRRLSYDVATVGSVEHAIRVLGTDYFDVLVVDVDLEGGSCQAVLARAEAMTAPPLCFLLAGRGTVRSAVEAMRRGAVDYLEKPIDIGLLTERVERALETATMRRKLRTMDLRERNNGHPVASSPQMALALKLADRVAATPSSSALILGESGVGKEVIAARIHERSKRRNGPFIRVNMAAIPDSMVEAELFGSTRGAFTDAKRDRVGYFASADGGTLLLDELCEFKVSLQSKLLRAIESRRFHPVGSDRERAFDSRILASTNRRPLEAVASGDLRADLYYRLAPIVIEVPPLRERTEDILPLAQRFLVTYSADFGAECRRLARDAEDALLAYAWPGNVRELRNVIERAVMLSDDPQIGVELLGLAPSPSTTTSGMRRRAVLPEAPAYGSDPPSLERVRDSAVTDSERALIVKVLEQTGGSKTRAAELLGVSRTTLWEKLKRYGLK